MPFHKQKENEWVQKEFMGVFNIALFKETYMPFSLFNFFFIFQKMDFIYGIPENGLKYDINQLRSGVTLFMSKLVQPTNYLSCIMVGCYSSSKLINSPSKKLDRKWCYPDDHLRLCTAKAQ